MSEWPHIKLGNITTKIGSGSTPTGGSNAYKESGISLIRSQNVLDLKFSVDGLAFIDDEQADKLKNVSVEENDVLLNITGDSVARCCKAPKEWLPARVNQHVAIIRSDKSILIPDFLKYSLVALKDELLMLSEIGGTRNALTKSMIEEFKINLPPLPEQKAIADVLSALDDKIDLLQRQNETLEKMAETLFRQWFIEEAKEDWELCSFEKWVSGTKGGDWGKEVPVDDFIKAVYCLRGTDIASLQKNMWVNAPLRFIKEKKFFSIEPDNGDIVIEISGGTETQSTGRSYYINEGVRKLFTQPIIFSNFCRLITVRNSEYSYFIYLYLKFLYDTDEFFALENGSSGIKNLNYKAVLFEQKFLMPAVEKVLDFHELVCSHFIKIDENRIQIQTLQNLRDTLLPKLMSGEVRVKLD